MEWVEKAIREMHRTAMKIEEEHDLPRHGYRGANSLFIDAADSIARAYNSATPQQQEAMERHTKRAAVALINCDQLPLQKEA